MFKLCPLDWTDLNPNAPTFTPRSAKLDTTSNVDNSDKKVILSQSSQHLVAIPTISGVNNNNNNNNNNSKTRGGKNKSKQKSSTKAPKLTLEQFITEKLTIDDKNKKGSTLAIYRNQSNSKKTTTVQTPRNILDSSAPSRKRGKEREIPKAKKPTHLKRIIHNERNGLLLPKDNVIQSDGQSCDEIYDLEALNKRLLHFKSFREYCCQQLTEEIDKITINLLSDLVLFQDRLHARDPIKASMKRRLIYGFKEVTKYAKINKLKLLIITPDIEKIESRGGLDDSLHNLITIAETNETHIVFALNMKSLGIVCKKQGIVSCVGVLNYDGSQDNFKQLINLSETARNDYKLIAEQSLDKLKLLSQQEIDELVKTPSDIPNEWIQIRNKLINLDKFKNSIARTNL
ncbi:selenocysteine insertion sequence-binding protein 2-like [Oppia nitens]|uniref:selenocysteine insertion sequence-binding protein 2-like n=1 Tax=Oppia nitens TaxID=1686743 RepID=UPI0023DC4967|nr:selenocysteine insertion sequence-binding protein 2-like [Oppia nitens]